jgi:hypothetical protein
LRPDPYNSSPGIIMQKLDVKPEVFMSVYNEFMSLLRGRGTNITIQESQELKDYARVRTDLKKQDKDLDDEQKVWKYIYNLVDEQMEKTIGKEEKTTLDDLADSYHEDMTLLNTLDESLATITQLAEETEKLLAAQWGYIAANWDKSTGYKERMDIFSDRMLDKSAGPEFHIQFAKEVLNLVSIHKKTLGDPLRKVNDDLQKQLLEVKKHLNRINALIEENKVKKLIESRPVIIEAVTEFNKWYEMTKEVCLVRRIQANYILSQEKWDSEIPNAVIEHKGDINLEMPRTFAEEMVKGTAEAKIAQEKDQELNAERKLISEKIFGKKQEVEHNQLAPVPATIQQTIPKKTGKVKGMSISLGVVLLGLIFVGMETTILGYVIILFGVVYGIKIILMK